MSSISRILNMDLKPLRKGSTHSSKSDPALLRRSEHLFERKEKFQKSFGDVSRLLVISKSLCLHAVTRKLRNCSTLLRVCWYVLVVGFLFLFSTFRCISTSLCASWTICGKTARSTDRRWSANHTIRQKKVICEQNELITIPYSRNAKFSGFPVHPRWFAHSV